LFSAAIRPAWLTAERIIFSFRRRPMESIIGIIAGIALGLAAGLLAIMLLPDRRSRGLIFVCLTCFTGR
jgi:hypothetical protein